MGRFFFTRKPVVGWFGVWYVGTPQYPGAFDDLLLLGDSNRTFPVMTVRVGSYLKIIIVTYIQIIVILNERFGGFICNLLSGG